MYITKEEEKIKQGDTLKYYSLSILNANLESKIVPRPRQLDFTLGLARLLHLSMPALVFKVPRSSKLINVLKSLVE